MTYLHKYSSPSDGDKAAELLKPDWYEFEIVDAFETDLEGNSLITRHGDPFMKLRVLELSSGTVLFHYLFFSEQGAARINAFLHATGASISEGEEVVLKGESFLGKNFRGKVEITRREGKDYNQVTRVRPSEAPQEVEPEPIEETVKENRIEDDDVPF